MYMRERERAKSHTQPHTDQLPTMKRREREGGEREREEREGGEREGGEGGRIERAKSLHTATH